MSDNTACGETMHSGLTCVLERDHDGEHYDKFGLRNPRCDGMGHASKIEEAH